MKTKQIPRAAIKLIEDLLNEQTYGKKNYAGNYYFPLSRQARIRTLEREYDIVFPMEIPEPYLSQYYNKLIKNSSDENGERTTAFKQVLPMFV